MALSALRSSTREGTLAVAGIRSRKQAAGPTRADSRSTAHPCNEIRGNMENAKDATSNVLCDERLREDYRRATALRRPERRSAHLISRCWILVVLQCCLLTFGLYQLSFGGDSR